MATSTTSISSPNLFTASANNCSLSIDDFNTVAIACQNVSDSWEQLAIRLNIDRVTVMCIQQERQGGDTKQCLNKLLTVWLRQTSPNQPEPTWRILCNAIAFIDKPLSKNIWADHTRVCRVCRGDHRTTPVATAVQQNKATEAAKELSALFDELLKFLIKEIEHVDVDELRLRLAQFFKREEELNDKTEEHLLKIEHYPTSKAILNYFVRHNFIGYFNYSLIKAFQEITQSPMLDKHIEQYEADYQCFLELSLSQIHDTFQQCPDLRPDYPAGIPKFTIHLQSEWDGKSTFDLKEFMKKCFANSDCIDQLMIAKISRNCIIITFAVLPHIAREVLEYLTNDDVLVLMKKEGISVDISEQLMKYKVELETTSMEQTPSGTGSETDPFASYNDLQDWDDTTTVTDITSGYGDSETNEYSRLIELKEDATVNETVDTCEKVVGVLRKRIKSLESQLVTHKQIITELDYTRDELKMTKQSLSEKDLVSMKREKDERKLELLLTKEDNLRKNDELLEAAKNGDTDHIEILVKSGADVNTRSFKDQWEQTPLHFASSNGYNKIVNLLISLGAKVNIKDDKGNTPLHMASLRGRNDTVIVLLSYGATVNKKNLWGNTPLHLASQYRHSGTVIALLLHGAHVDSLNKYRQTPLLYCFTMGTNCDNIKATAALLISRGADLYHEDEYGNSPVMVATVFGYDDLMLSHGVSEDITLKYRLPIGWEASYYDGHIRYTNTVTGGEQFTHPSLSDCTH